VGESCPKKGTSHHPKWNKTVILKWEKRRGEEQKKTLENLYRRRRDVGILRRAKSRRGAELEGKTGGNLLIWGDESIGGRKEIGHLNCRIPPTSYRARNEKSDLIEKKGEGLERREGGEVEKNQEGSGHTHTEVAMLKKPICKKRGCCVEGKKVGRRMRTQRIFRPSTIGAQIAGTKTK